MLPNQGTGSDSRGGQREIYGFENFHFRLFPFADPSWREQSFSRNGLPSRNGGVEVCFSTRGRESAGGRARARAGSHSTHSAVRCRRQQRRLKDHFLPASLPRPRARTRPVVPLFHPYHTLSSPTFTLPVGSPPRLPSLQLFSFPSLLPRSESETSSLFPKFPPLPFHSVALSFRQVCCTSLQCPSRTAVSPPFPLPLALTNHDTFVLYFPQFFLPPLSRTLPLHPDLHPRFSNGLRPRAFCASDLFPTLPSLLYCTRRSAWVGVAFLSAVTSGQESIETRPHHKGP